MASESSFNPAAPVFRAVAFADAVRLELLMKLRTLFQWLFLILLSAFAGAFLVAALPEAHLSLLLASVFFSFALWGVSLLLELFGNHLKGKSSEGPFSFELARAYAHARKDAKGKPLSSSSLLKHILEENDEWRSLLRRALISDEELLKALRDAAPDEAGEETLKEALKGAQGPVRIGDALAVLAEKNAVFKGFLLQAHLSAQDIDRLAAWLQRVKKREKTGRAFWRKENLLKRGTLGRNWTSGYALTLESFSRDVSKEAKLLGFPMPIGHEQQLEALERQLGQESASNALLVGEQGVGKRDLVVGFAGKSTEGDTFPELRYQRVLELDMSALLANVTDAGEREVALDAIFREVVQAGNIVLVIDNFHQYVGMETKPGVVDITGILSSYLKMPSFKFIALTDYNGLHREIEQLPALLSLLGKVEVPEISREAALSLLLYESPGFERRYEASISYPALREVATLAERYITDEPFPQKAERLLEEAMAYLSQTKETVLLPKHVSELVSRRTKIPIGELEEEEKQKLLNLESLIHQRLINQEEAVKQIASSLRRARTEVGSRKGPMGSFLFLGPTGVGKTEAAKTLSAIYFGSESAMIRLDMSEFQQISDIPRLLGGKGEEGLLTTPIREHPFSLLLLDELEKAHPNILNLFLQVLDEGQVTDGMGRKVDFRHAIIIATSNAGYQLILDAIKEGKDFETLQQEIIDSVIREGAYRPEFLNRFDAVVVFKPLSKENLLDISQLMLEKVQRNLKKQGVEFVITLPLKEKIVELGYDPKFGARYMSRVIQDNVENALATGFLKGKLPRGAAVEVSPEDFALRVR